jgi:hypothetical protein
LKINLKVSLINLAIYPNKIESKSTIEIRMPEVINHFKEEETRQVPKPIEMNMKLNDLRNIKTGKHSLPTNSGVKYMPDIMAERLVCEILDKK